MTVRKEFTFLSSDQKTMLHGIAWLPEGKAKAVVQICHGVAEYLARYDDFARFLAEHGFAVFGHDHLGHGGSAKPGADCVDFGPGNSWHTVVNDIYVLHNRLVKTYKDAPHILLGHSMGSFLVRTYLIRYPGTVQAAILMGTGWQGSVTIAGAKVLTKLFGRKKLDRSNQFITNLAFGSYNKRFKPIKTAYDWVAADQDHVRDYLLDPLCGQDVSVGLFREMLTGFSFNQKFANLDQMEKNMPVLFISGADDPVGDFSAGVKQTYGEFKSSGMRDCSMILYPGLRHEILHEKAHRPTIYADLLHWMEEKAL